MSDAFGPMLFRAPLDAAVRRAVATPRVQAGDVIANWPREAIALTGTWPAIADPPTIRPIYPGAMRFLANDVARIPDAEQIETVAGRVTDACLSRCTLTGTVLIRIEGAKPLRAITELGVLAPLGVPPTRAFYGPVTLTEKFLRSALLDYEHGMVPCAFYVGLERINPGEPEWEALALQKFLSGLYEPVLRAREALDDDDAARLPMPQLVLGPGGAFALGVALGWSRTRTLAPSGPVDPDLEIVPTLPFLRHVARKLREPVKRTDGVDPLIADMIEDEDTSELWTARLANKLYSIGFGDIARTMPLGEVLREFQISASGATAAVARDATVTDEKLAERNFADLKAQANLHRYDGPISGRANAATRRALDEWTMSGQRCPVLIPAYPTAALDPATLRPKAGEVPTFRDLWKRQETLDISLRMFAADFSQVEAGSSVGLGELEPIGHCSRWAKTQSEVFFGPGTLPPTAVSRVDNAEVTPRRLLEVSEEDLLTPMPPDDPGLLSIRSTFKVIRAVSEFECLGYLDQVNAYDNAGISFGPCHWSMALAIDAPKGNTELGGFAAYLTFLAERQSKPEFDVFRAHGVTADGNKGADRAATARRSSDAAFRNQLQFLDDRGEPVPMNAAGPRDIIPSWRSYQRWIAIGRRHPLIGQAAWGLAVRRLHALRAVPISLEEPPEDARPNIGAMPTIGKVFTSELAMARIMRWHTKIASGVAKGVGKDLAASRYIAAAYMDARPADRADPAAWEEELLRTLSVQLDQFVASTGTSHAELPGNFEDLADPDWTHTETIPPGANPRAYGLDPRLRRLSREAGSFKLASLPAAMVP